MEDIIGKEEKNIYLNKKQVDGYKFCVMRSSLFHFEIFLSLDRHCRGGQTTRHKRNGE